MISPLIRPVNIFACTQGGTIFSSSGSGSGGGTIYTFTNLGGGAQVLAQVIGTNVQFRTLINGNNVTIVQEANDITFSVEDLLFDSTSAAKRQIIGLQGVVLGKTTIKQTLQELLYPVLPPGAVFTLNTLQFEYGDTSNLVATWTATKTDEPIVAITVGGISQTITGNTQSGTQNVTKTGLIDKVVTMVVTTATKSTTYTLTSSVSRKLRWGNTTKDGTIAPILDADITALGGSQFTPNRQIPIKFQNVPASNYFIIEIPVAFGSPFGFKINGVLNNAFTKVRTASPYVNSFGYTDSVDVYVSNVFSSTSTSSLSLEIF